MSNRDRYSLIDFILRIRNRLEMSPLFKEIERHLEFHGYTVKYEDDVLKAVHSSKPAFWVHPSLEGALFMALFELGPGARSNRNALYAFVNKATMKSIVAKFGSNDDSLAISAWYPNLYDKRSFSEFFDQYMADINAPPVRDSTEVQNLFWSNPPSIPGLE